METLVTIILCILLAMGGITTFIGLFGLAIEALTWTQHNYIAYRKERERRALLKSHDAGKE